jgi:hypothetical protein
MPEDRGRVGVDMRLPSVSQLDTDEVYAEVTKKTCHGSSQSRDMIRRRGSAARSTQIQHEQN